MFTRPDKNGTSYQQFRHDQQSASTIIVCIALWLVVLVCIGVYWPAWCVWAYLAVTVALFARKLVKIYRSPRGGA